MGFHCRLYYSQLPCGTWLWINSPDANQGTSDWGNGLVPTGNHLLSEPKFFVCMFVCLYFFRDQCS